MKFFLLVITSILWNSAISAQTYYTVKGTKFFLLKVDNTLVIKVAEKNTFDREAKKLSDSLYFIKVSEKELADRIKDEIGFSSPVFLLRRFNPNIESISYDKELEREFLYLTGEVIFKVNPKVTTIEELLKEVGIDDFNDLKCNESNVCSFSIAGDHVKLLRYNNTLDKHANVVWAEPGHIVSGTSE